MDANLLGLGMVAVVGVTVSALVSIFFGRPFHFRANREEVELSTNEKAETRSKTRPK